MAAAGEEHHDHNTGGSEIAVSATPSHDPKLVKDETETELLGDDTTEYVEKYRRYQADYSRRLKAKYFSKLAFDGTRIFSEEVTVENEVIKASRFRSTRSFIDPVLSLEDQSSLSVTATETSTVPSSSRKNLRRSN